MFLLLVLSIVPVLTQNILGVFYSFNTDFYRTFNEKKCVNSFAWNVIDYESIEVPHPSEKSSTGIVASTNSCASSFPIILVPNSTLEFTVYMRTLHKNSGLIISVINAENNNPIIKGYYNKTSEGFVLGWSKLRLDIKEDGACYINFRGRSRRDEIVLIDSFHYNPNTPKTEDTFEGQGFDEILQFIPRRLEVLNDELDNEDNELNDWSDNDEGSGDYEEPIIVEEARLGTWSIVLISVGVVTVVGLIGVGSYHYGKIRGIEANILNIDAEPPRVYNIPRIRGVLNNVNRRYD